MGRWEPAGTRRRQILHTLNNNGPLSASTLHKILRPIPTLRSIQFALKRLLEKGIVEAHFESVSQRAGQFYRITHDLSAREKVAKWLEVPADQLRQPKFFSKELLHTTQCALWAALLKDEFPDGEVLRDIQVVKSRMFRTIVEYEHADPDLVPDILLSFPNERRDDMVVLGIEIEKTRKSNLRLIRKLDKVVNRTHLDGVVYVCDGQGVKDAIQGVLSRSEVLLSSRISHYANAFILFTDNKAIAGDSFPSLQNIEGKLVSLRDWMATMRTISSDYRRNSHF